MTDQEKYDCAVKAFKKTNEICRVWAKREFERRCDKIIDKFYDFPERRMYHPKGNLYNAYKGIFDGSDIELYLGTDYMKEHYKRKADKEYIYELTIRKGYHGGAIKGKDHPCPEVPYWRTPAPLYPKWGDRAIKEEDTPLEEIVEMVKKLNEDFKEKQKEVLIKTLTQMGFYN